MKHTILVSGRPITEIGPTAGLRYSHGWPYGSLRASWQMDPVRHSNLFGGASVVMCLGGAPVWRGFLNEPGRDGTMTALGAWEQGKGAQCLSVAGPATAEPREAVAQAMNRGVLTAWYGPVPDIYPGAAAQQMDAPYPAQSVVSLLDDVTGKLGSRWAVDPFTGRLVVDKDPTSPTWCVPHQVAGQGLTPADDNVATHLIAEYLSAAGQLAITSPAVVSPDYITGTPKVERLVSLIDKGFISDATARTYLSNMFGTGVGKVGWADGLLLGWGDVYTMGGQVIEPCAVVAGSMGRLAGVWDDRAATPFGNTDIVAAETEYDEEKNTVQVKPVGLQPRTIGEVQTWVA